VREHVFVQWRPPDPWSYSYLLGLYLGDGCVVQHERAARLVITLDGLYPDIIDEAVAADQLAVPQQRVMVERKQLRPHRLQIPPHVLRIAARPQLLRARVVREQVHERQPLRVPRP